MATQQENWETVKALFEAALGEEPGEPLRLSTFALLR